MFCSSTASRRARDNKRKPTRNCQAVARCKLRLQAVAPCGAGPAGLVASRCACSKQYSHACCHSTATSSFCF